MSQHSLSGARQECSVSGDVTTIKSEPIDSDRLARTDELADDSVQEYTDLDSKKIVCARKSHLRPSARLEQKRFKLKQPKTSTTKHRSQQKNCPKQVIDHIIQQSDSQQAGIRFEPAPKSDVIHSDTEPATTNILLSGTTDLLPLSPPLPADSDIRGGDTPGAQAIPITTYSDPNLTPQSMTVATAASVEDRADMSAAKQFQTASCHLQTVPVLSGDTQETETGCDYIDLDSQQRVKCQKVISSDNDSSVRDTQIDATQWSTLAGDQDQDNRLVADQENANNISNARRSISQPKSGTFSKISDAQFECLRNLIKIIRSGNYSDFSELLERRSIKSNLMNVFVDGHTPLHYSIMYGRSLDWCRQLVLNGADPNLSNRAGWHPIHLAAFNGSRDTMRYLIECYADQ